MRRTRVNAVAPEQHRRADPAFHRQPTGGLRQRGVHPRIDPARTTASVTCGRLVGERCRAWLGSPASASAVQSRRIAASVSSSKSNSTECAIRRDLAPSPGRMPPRSALAKSAALADPAPAGSTARSGASSPSASRLPASATPGSPGHAPITRPAHETSCARKGFQRQRGVVEGAQPGLDDDQHRAHPDRRRGRAASPRLRRVPPADLRRPRRRSACPVRPIPRMSATSSARVGNAIAARSAAATGASGSG